MPVAHRVRELVLRRADGRCEYCRIAGWPLTVDHIVAVVAFDTTPPDHPIRSVGLDHPDNLAAACSPCNRAKSGATHAYDELTGTVQPLFDPRRMRWEEHFAWSDDGLDIVGVTAIGRATAVQLRLHREVYRRQRALLRTVALSGGPRWP